MKMNKSKLLFSSIIAALMVGVAPVASADILPGDLNRFVTKCDVNKDGMISRSEFIDMALEKVKPMADKNGMVDSKKAMRLLLDITKGEFNAGDLVSNDAFMKKLGAMFDKMDTKKVGMMDKKQFEKFLLELQKSAG